jgi:hypothetical protein
VACLLDPLRERVDFFDRMNPIAIDGEMAAKFECARLASGAQDGIFNGLEIGIMRETENAPMHLNAGEAKCIGPKIGEEMVERLLGAEPVSLILE